MSAKCYSGRIFENLSAKHGSIKKQHRRRYFHILLGAVYKLFQFILIIFLFFLSQYFRMRLLRIGTPTPIKSTTAKIVKSIQSPHISFFFIIRMDKMMETAYITTIAKTARKTRSIGEDSMTKIIEFPIAGILERRSKVTKKPTNFICIPLESSFTFLVGAM